ncbi:hypothetical protein MHU86_14804 [Fragilaria crotonensis]|nr:hypothetical protein MHU86_14804 [Fragilaria crotonensis]
MKSQLLGLRFQLRGNGASTPLLPHNPNEERNLDPAGKNKKKTSWPVGTLLCALTAPLVLLSLSGSVILSSTTSDVHRLLRSLNTEWTLESTCKEHPAWENDIFWRTSTLNPIVCDPADDLANQTLARSRLGIEDLRDSLHLRNPCGSYCAFHTDSLAKRRRGEHLLLL